MALLNNIMIVIIPCGKFHHRLNLVKELMSSDIIFTKSEILLGIEIKGMYFWPCIFLIGKCYIFLCHDNVRRNWEQFKIKVQEIILIKYNIAVKNKK